MATKKKDELPVETPAKKAKVDHNTIKARAAKLKSGIGELLRKMKEPLEDEEIVKCKDALRSKRAELSEIWDTHSKDGKLFG